MTTSRRASPRASRTAFADCFGHGFAVDSNDDEPGAGPDQPDDRHRSPRSASSPSISFRRHPAPRSWTIAAPAGSRRLATCSGPAPSIAASPPRLSITYWERILSGRSPETTMIPSSARGASTPTWRSISSSSISVPPLATMPSSMRMPRPSSNGIRTRGSRIHPACMMNAATSQPGASEMLSRAVYGNGSDARSLCSTCRICASASAARSSQYSCRWSVGRKA